MVHSGRRIAIAAAIQNSGATMPQRSRIFRVVRVMALPPFTRPLRRAGRDERLRDADRAGADDIDAFGAGHDHVGDVVGADDDDLA